MAELQTVSAAFDVARLAWAACVFLKKVKDADKTAEEVHERVLRLKQVLDGVRGLLETREEKGVAPHDRADVESEERIRKCIQASRSILLEVEKKVGGFDSSASGTALIDKVKIALRQPSIKKLQTDLEARISALQTELSILQLSDHAHTHQTIGLNHQELLLTLSQLREQLNSGNKLLNHLLLEQRKLSVTQQSVSPQDVNETAIEEVDPDSGALESLVDCLHNAEEVHERYTSEYAPDDRSIRFHNAVVSEQDRSSPLALATPVSEDSSAIPFFEHSRSYSNVSQTDVVDDNDDDDADVWPLEILNMHIDAYHERAHREREQGHFNQAEVNLQSAVRYSEMRERHYGIPFNDRVRLQEEVAMLYQKQAKWGEAVAKLHQLLRESPDEHSQARQNQLLASTYYDRHQNRSGPALSNLTEDIENAERHAKKAFKKRYTLLKADNTPSEEAGRHNSCTALLVRILETRDKTVEANELTKLMSDSSSIASDSMRRISTAGQRSDFILVEDKHELLINAIKSGDSEQVQNLLNDGDIKIEQLSRDGKTPLMYAVERSDETIVHKLLDPIVGADVNNANKRGLTALHHAASLGLDDMVRCLLHHDAEKEARDKRGETPLMKAVQNDQGTIVQILSDTEADLETKNADEWSLLHYSIRLSKTNMINHLLDLAPDLKDAVDQAGKTALHHCADLELVVQAAALLSHKNKVDVNAVDSVSRSPLYFAASKPPTPRRESVVQLLVDHDARMDVNRPPPRYRDYVALKAFHPRRLTRHDSVSTEGSVGTTSTGVTKLSRIFSGRMHLR